MKKIDIKLYVMACMLLVSSLGFGQLKFGDKSTVGQTLTLDNALGVATLDLTFNTDKSLSSIVLNADSAAVGKDYYNISISKCQNNKGFGVDVYDESDQAIVNDDFRCRLGRMSTSNENPVRVASIDSLVSILDAYAVNDAATSTSRQKPAHCLFDLADDNQAFGAWPGKYKKVKYGFNVKFSGQSLDTDITFSIDTYDEGNTGSTASYSLTVLIAGVDTVTIDDYYVTGTGVKNVSLAADAGFGPGDFTGQNVFWYLETTGTGTPVADDSFDPVIVFDNLKIVYNSPAWIQPAAGIEVNSFQNSLLRGEAGVETTFAVPIQTKNRMAALTIVNDLYLNGDGLERPYTLVDPGALKANDGSGNYTVDVDYTLEPSTFDAGSGKWSDAKITVAAPPSGVVNDDMMLFFKATPVAGEELISRFELDNGTRIFYDVSVIEKTFALMHSYTFEDADTVIDVVGDLNGTLHGSKITVADGKATVSGATASTDGYISLDADALDLKSYSAVTLEAYLETGEALNGSYSMLAYFGNNTGGNKCFWIQPTRNGNETRIETNNGSTTATAALSGYELDDGKMHHVVASLSATALKYYIDGDLVASAALDADYVSTLDTVIANIFKGPNGWGDPNYNVSLDEFNIYDGVMDDALISSRALEYIAASNSQLSGLTVDAGAIAPSFNPMVHSYYLALPDGTTTLNVDAVAKASGSTVTGTGSADVSSGSGVIEIQVVSEDENDTTVYSIVYGQLELMHAYNFENPDSVMDVVGTLGGTREGNATIENGQLVLDEAGDWVSFDGAALDLNSYPAITMEYVYTSAVGANDDHWNWSAYFGGNGGSNCTMTAFNTWGQIRFWKDNSSARGVVTNQLDDGKPHHVVTVVSNNIVKLYVDGALIGTKEGVGNLVIGTENAMLGRAYWNDPTWMGTIDEFNIYSGMMDDAMVAEQAKFALNTTVAYVTEDKVMDATATQPDNDPIIQMLKNDPNVWVDVMTVANDAVLDLSRYDVVVGQEPFGSSSAIWKRGGTLGMGSLTVPHIINKVYTMKDGRGFQDGAAGSGGEQAGDYYLHVDPAKQSSPLFNGLTFEGDSVQIFLNGYKDDGGADDAYHKGLQYAVDVVLSPDTTLMALSTMAPANATVGINYLGVGDVIGSETMQAPMITMGMNFGAISAAGGDNITEAGLTLWRNAIYMLAGLEVPAEAVSKSIEVEVDVAAAVMKGSDGNAYQFTVPSGTTAIDLDVNVVNGKDAVIPTISGLSDGQDAEYELKVFAPVGTDSMVYKVYVHVQSEGEILYCSASNGVYATAKAYDTNVYDALVEGGYSVTFAKKGSIFEWTPDGINAFDYTPYAGMVIGGGESSSNVNDYAKRNYPIPCVSMQNDGPKNNKWGWVNDKKAEEFAKFSDFTVETAQMKILNNTHPITAGYDMDQLITWSDGTPDSADWPKEVKSYNLMDSVPDAIPLATFNEESLYPTMWAVPKGSEVRSMNGDYDTYEHVTTASNVVLLYAFNDGLLYMTDEFKPLLLNSLDWAINSIPLTLKHSYPFDDGTAVDVIAGADGVLQGDATVADGVVTLSGTGFVSLPGKEINVPEYGQLSVEAVFTQAAGLDGFTVLYNFGETSGTIGANYFICQPTRNDGDQSRASVSCLNTTDPWLTENGVMGNEIKDAETHHVVTILTHSAIKYYLDGVLVGTDALTGNNSLANISSDTAYIGKSVYSGDPLWQGSVDIVNIYQGEMDAAKVAERAAELLPGPKKVAYVTESKTMAETATQPDNDPIVTMLMKDDNFVVDTWLVANDSVFDLSGYDVVIGQEPFGSSSAIWKRDGSLGMGSLTVPHIINKVYAMKAGRGFATGASGSGGEQASDFYLHVDPANQANDLFKGLTFVGDSIRIFLEGFADDGSADGEHFKGLQYATDVMFNPANSALAMSTKAPANATVGINYLATGDSIGSEEMQAPMITMAMNYGAICGNSGKNITAAGLTIWRNAVYMLAGLPVPEEAYTSVSKVRNDAVSVSVYPNPARDVVNISFGLDRKAAVSLSVYSVSGQLVELRDDKLYESGEHKLTVNTSEMKAGLYIYKLNIGEESATGILSITK
ncbi:LamG-like jellyroll fold domain-containing protein [Saccharicrinis sp. FJH54]|uniref:LamG-like jellyroll fold domain-containing protein n=1 Tax=Saccharicrinis sp. FJH54 TaxID=3344665 RepID=UPI0035D3EDBF